MVKEEHYQPIEIFKDKLLKIGKVCTKEEQQAFVSLCHEFNDIFAWEYGDLKGFDPILAEHIIDLEPNSKLVRQRQRPLNPKMEHLMKVEINKLIQGKQRLAALPLQPIKVEQPFMKWGFDFTGPINPPSSAIHRWILIATDYFTKWIEGATLKEANETVVLSFYQDLVASFDVPKSVIYDNALDFIGLKVTNWALENEIYLNTSSNYYPQGNSPYVLVYGNEARLPILVDFPTLSLIQELEMMEEEPMHIIYVELLELKEKRKRALINLENHHVQMKRNFDKKVVPRVFREGELVFKWNKLKSILG
ncbi:uncharacterized protein LOC131857679 [Cryptomeria japonica]|uniref:uncharacterized protein LOC131857679 n=1 Tax=Cryptomeria japonica TaxID=3369 RepID=UPI0027DAA5A8|nr:uncharacterized protein LOC131857679 [Cryptomeria japonica]